MGCVSLPRSSDTHILWPVNVRLVADLYARKIVHWIMTWSVYVYASVREMKVGRLPVSWDGKMYQIK